MTNPLGILGRSALGKGTKVAIACSEVMRRLKNFSTHVNKDRVEEVIQGYMDNLLGMGYPSEWREKVSRSSLK